MTQEESKRFLTSKTPKEKFNFFKLGTSLAQIERNYTDTAKILRDAANDIGLTKTAVDDLKMEEKKASSELNKLSRARETDDKIKQAIAKLVWCPVRKHEEDLAGKEKEISLAENRVQKHTEARDKENKKLEEAQKRCQSCIKTILAPITIISNYKCWTIWSLLSRIKYCKGKRANRRMTCLFGSSFPPERSLRKLRRRGTC